jgi:hypothetical protein
MGSQSRDVLGFGRGRVDPFLQSYIKTNSYCIDRFEMSFQGKQEKRQHGRFKVKGLDITGRTMFASMVKINDISANSVSLKADRRMEIGRVYPQIRISK